MFGHRGFTFSGHTSFNEWAEVLNTHDESKLGELLGAYLSFCKNLLALNFLANLKFNHLAGEAEFRRQRSFIN